MKMTMKAFVASMLLIGIVGMALKTEAKPKSAVVTIKTSAICGSCKARIEKALTSTDGIEEAVLNVTTKNVKVKYNPTKISENQIRLVIVNTGYDADDMKRDEAAFKKLPMCCQTEGAEHH